MSTCPLGSNVAVWPCLGTDMPPVAVKVGAAGSYTFALASAEKKTHAPGNENHPVL